MKAGYRSAATAVRHIPVEKMTDPVGKLKAYIVVLAPAFLGSLHGDTSKVIVGPDKSISYRGVDRSPWWNLYDSFYSGLLDSELADVRRVIEKSVLGEFSEGVCYSLDTARRIQALSVSRPLKDEIICIASAFEAADNDSNFLGYDCYVDGFGSPLRLGIFSATTALADFEDRLNAHGLFSTLGDLRDYVDAYCGRCEHANLEIIEPDRVSDACYIRVFGV